MTADPGKLSVELLDAAVELMGRSGRGGAVRVQGTSMLPTLTEGQLLAVEFAPSRLRQGDMLVFRQVDYLVVHRLLGRAGRRQSGLRYRTRGDGLPGFDPPVTADRVVGRVTAFELRDEWRSVRSRAARAYARLLAWHDLFWAGGGLLAARGEGLLRRLRLRVPLLAWVQAVDRRALGAVHVLLFERVHPVIPTPAEVDSGAGRAAREE